MKRPLRTEKELWDWFRYMRNFDLTRLEERRQLIDVFVNTVFLYNDRFLLTLNFGYGSKTVLFTDIPCSDKVACGRPRITVFRLIFTEDRFLCLLHIIYCTLKTRKLLHYEAVSVSFFRCSFSALIRFRTSSIIVSSSFSHSSRFLAYTV